MFIHVCRMLAATVPEPLLLADVISNKISYNGSIVCYSGEFKIFMKRYMRDQVKTYLVY